MTTYLYTDGYCASQVTQDREDRAIADVAQLGAFPSTWVDRLCILRAYIITALECAKSPDDMWSTKLSAYRKEFDSALPQARAAQAAAIAASSPAASGASIFSVELFRG